MKIGLSLFLFFIILLIYPSIIYVYDIESNEIIPFVIVQYKDIKRQYYVPFELYNVDSIYISSIGYMPKYVHIDKDTIRIFLNKKNIVFDTIYIKDKYTSTDFKTIDNKENFLYEFNNLLYIKNYGRTQTLSIDNSRTEEINISVNNKEVSISSGISNIDLIPFSIFNKITVSKFNKNNLGHYNNIDFTISQKNNTMILFNGNFRDKRIGIISSVKGIGIGYDYTDYDCLILTNREELKNSYLKKRGFLFFINKNNFQFLMFNNFSKTGDPGIMGFNFDSAYTKQNLKHIQITTGNSIFSISTIINHYTYNYNNMEIGSINDSANGLNTYCIVNVKHFGFGVEYDYLNGTRTNEHFRVNPFVLLNYKFNKINTDIRIDKLKSSTFNIMYNNKTYKMGILLKLREPTFNELYWDDIYAEGNEQLKNEKIVNIFYKKRKNYNFINIQYEMGLKLSFDLINWQSVNGVFTPINNQKVYMPYLKILFITYYKGFYINTFLNLNPTIIDKNYNYNDAFLELYNVNNITQYFAFLPYSTIYTFGNNLIWAYKDFKISLNSVFISKRYINTYNTKFLKEYFIINDINVSYKYNIMEYSINFNNPLNIYFESIRGYPNEGFNIKFNLKLEVL